MVVCGVQMWDTLKKWQFSDIISKEITKFSVIFDSDNMIDLRCEILSILENKPGALKNNYY